MIGILNLNQLSRMAHTYNNTTVVRVCSYNMHGFTNGLPLAKELCNDHDVILLQEHWLLQDNLHKISSISSEFQAYSLSSMNEKIARGILVGRPFGGVAVLWRKSLACLVKVIHADEGDGKLITISIGKGGAPELIITCV